MKTRACPQCHAALDASGSCASCGAQWLAPSRIETLAPGRLGPLRRLAGKGPLTQFNCAECGFALKSLDVAGFVHEADLFWGLETARPAGTSTAEACARCGGVFVDRDNVSRAGGVGEFEKSLARLAREAS